MGGPGVSDIAFDNWSRSTFRATTPEGRALADNLSHVGQITNGAMVLTLDLYKGIEKRDWRIAALGIGADFGVVGAGFLLDHFALKQGFKALKFNNLRPMADQCAKDPSYDTYCTNGELETGMPSDDSYVAAAFAGVALGNVVSDPQLRQKPWLVALVAGTGLVGTLSTNLGRIAADKHWATETLAGDAVGYAVGFGGTLLTRHFLPSLSFSPEINAHGATFTLSGVF